MMKNRKRFSVLSFWILDSDSWVLLYLMQLRSILLPTDFSECAGHALSYATDLARDAGAKLLCVHVIEPVMPTVGYTGITEPLPVADISEQMETSATRELPKIAGCEECAGLEVEEVIAHGDP